MSYGTNSTPNLNSHKYYEAFAPQYDVVTGEEDREFNNRVAEAVARSQAQGRLLDVGAGTGETILALLRYGIPLSAITAIDPSRGMLNELSPKLPEERIRIVQRDVGDFLTDPKELRQRYDLITCVSCLELIQDAPSILGGLAGILAVNGVMAITYVEQTDPSISKQIMRAAFDDAYTLHYYPEEIIDNSIAMSGLTTIFKQRVYAYTRRPPGEAPQDVMYTVQLARRFGAAED